MLRPIPLVYFDKGKPPRVADPVAFWPNGVEQRVGGPRRPPPKPPKVKPAEGMGSRPIPKKPRQARKKAPPKRDLPQAPAPPPPDPAELQRRATSALRAYLRAYERGGYLAAWLRDGKRHRVVDAQDQAYARGDKTTQDVAGRLLALTGEQREAVRRASGVGADIGRVKPEGEP